LPRKSKVSDQSPDHINVCTWFIETLAVQNVQFFEKLVDVALFKYGALAECINIKNNSRFGISVFFGTVASHVLIG